MAQKGKRAGEMEKLRISKKVGRNWTARCSIVPEIRMRTSQLSFDHREAGLLELNDYHSSFV